MSESEKAQLATDLYESFRSVPQYFDHKCMYCHGLGWTSKGIGTITCDLCHGTGKMSRNKDILEKFTKYCNENPDLTFWKALFGFVSLNYKYNFIYFSNMSAKPQLTMKTENLVSPFYWDF